jgi:purine-nucleoside phosphorylase
MTPHNEARLNDYAKIVLMPGDPLRAKWIAETFLENVVLVNSVRNCLGFTGTYKGKPISVQASGMGQPSLGIYVHELYEIYNVESIIRVGSCGAIKDSIQINDVVVAMTSCTDNAMSKAFSPDFHFSPCCDYNMLERFINHFPDKDKLHVGSITANDYFYQPDKSWWHQLRDMGVLAVEMETHMLYTLSMKFDKKALSVNTVSDHLNGNSLPMTPKERESGFSKMLISVLESVK